MVYKCMYRQQQQQQQQQANSPPQRRTYPVPLHQKAALGVGEILGEAAVRELPRHGQRRLHPRLAQLLLHQFRPVWWGLLVGGLWFCVWLVGWSRMFFF